MSRRRVVGVLLGVLAGASYGTGPFFFKTFVYPAGVGWGTMLMWRFLFAVVISWAWLLAQPQARSALRRLDRVTTLKLMFVGTLFTVNAGLYYAAMERIDTSIVGLLMSTFPALVAIVSLRLGYPLSGRLAWGSLAVVIFGSVLTIGGIGAGTDALGIGLSCVGPFAYTVYIMATAWMAGERPGQTADMRSHGRGADVPPAVAGAVMMTGTWLATLVVAVVAAGPILPGDIPAGAWPGLIGIGVFAAAIAIQAFYASAARIGAAQASLTATVEPVVIICLGVAFLGENVSALRMAGIVVVLAGVVLAQLATPAESRPVLLEEP